MKLAAIVVLLITSGCSHVEWTLFPEQNRDGIIVVVEGDL